MLQIFKEVQGGKVFMSKKEDGNMKLFSSNFELNRKKYLEKIGLKCENLVSAKLEHDNKVKIIKDNKEKFIEYADGLLTSKKNVILNVTSADCLPIFLFDPIKKVIGILHCGWRSVSKGIIEKALNKMESNFESDLKNIQVGIGPGIQKCHFEVKKDFREKFEGCEKFILNKNEKKFFNLTRMVIEKFIFIGIKKNNIEIDWRCTYCEDELYSYRRDGVDKEGNVQAMIAGIKLKS